jgi:predicted AlkP superfamily pyrophosphatase or phosphodiesterase
MYVCLWHFSRIVFVLVATIALTLVLPAAWAADAEHVVVIGVDGMSPGGIHAAATPNMDALMQRGAYTMKARSVLPTSSSPNWASMIMGAGPEQHGVTSNDWKPDAFEIAPTAIGPGGFFPTIFSVLRERRPESHIAVLYDWGGFGRLFEHEVVDWQANTKGPEVTTTRAAEYIVEHRPTLTFIHLDHVDHAGHSKGWGSPEYIQAVEEADGYVGDVIQAINEAGISDSTIVIVASDHGGTGTKHGGATMDEIEIPWIIAGPGVAPGREITVPVDIYQTAATIAHVLKVETPPAWIAKPVIDAFGE